MAPQAASEMRLEDKGEIRPPPVLGTHPQRVSLAIQSWPGVIAATHWHLYDRTQVDGADFYLGRRELGHIHLDGEIHLLATKGLRNALVSHGLAEPFVWSDGWVQYTIRTKADVQHGLWLFRLAYDRLSGVARPELQSRLTAYAIAFGSEYVA